MKKDDASYFTGDSWSKLQQDITACTRCPRLISHIKETGRVKVRRFREETYWSRPVPGFGDPEAKVYILGLAPAAHGANRTGRMFTGDSSGDWLVRALHHFGFANQDRSVSRADGLQLRDVYISSAVHCAPPGNKPLASERGNCSEYFQRELHLLRSLKVIIALGGMAFQSLSRYIEAANGLPFGHAITHKLSDGLWLISSYHPSRQNTQTGRLSWEAWLEVFRKTRDILASA